MCLHVVLNKCPLIDDNNDLRLLQVFFRFVYIYMAIRENAGPLDKMNYPVVNRNSQTLTYLYN